MATLPTGTVTLLFTDIEGSTKLLQRAGDGYTELLDAHRKLLRRAFEEHGGVEVDTEGDAFFVAFASPDGAVDAARDAQEALAAYEWTDGNEIRVRMGLHTGTPQVVDRRYVGLDVHHAARVMAAGHGGQVLLTAATRERLAQEPSLIDLGEHRLKDLLQPEHLFQLVLDGLPTEFPALKTLGNRPNNLPQQPNALIGRDRELEALLSQVRQDDARLLTLVGVGGTGKTRLALQAAAELLEDFRSGVFFVSLSPIWDPALVLPTIARTLALRETGGEDIADTLRSYLSDKQMLIVVDNFEQVVDAAVSLESLLSAAPDVKLLVTTRTRLRLSRERIFEVPPLDWGSAESLLVSRARVANPDFAPKGEDIAAVAEICRRVDGLPLALELAAARVVALTPQALLRRLDERLSVLTGGTRDLEERQQTLRATIAWSYDLLNEDERGLFARLSVFVDGGRLDAVETVCNAKLDVLQSLIESSLLKQRTDPDGEPRFWLLETIKEFAHERLADSGAAEKIADAHAAFYGRLADDADTLTDTPDAPVGFGRLGCDRDNILAALTRLRQSGDDRRFVELAAGMANFWTMRGELREGRYWLEAALSTGAGDLQTVERALRFAFWMAVLANDADDAEGLAEKRAEIAEALGEDRRRAGAVLAFAQVAQMRGDYLGARDLHVEAVRVSRLAGDGVVVASPLVWLWLRRASLRRVRASARRARRGAGDRASDRPTGGDCNIAAASGGDRAASGVYRRGGAPVSGNAPALARPRLR